MYARLTEQVVDPLIAVLDDLIKLLETPDEQVDYLIQSIYSALLSLFTLAFVQPFSKEPESILPTSKRLES